jgi:hypothetical protein
VNLNEEFANLGNKTNYPPLNELFKSIHGVYLDLRAKYDDEMSSFYYQEETHYTKLHRWGFQIQEAMTDIRIQNEVLNNVFYRQRDLFSLMHNRVVAGLGRLHTTKAKLRTNRRETKIAELALLVQTNTVKRDFKAMKDIGKNQEVRLEMIREQKRIAEAQRRFTFMFGELQDNYKLMHDLKLRIQKKLHWLKSKIFDSLRCLIFSLSLLFLFESRTD